MRHYERPPRVAGTSSGRLSSANPVLRAWPRTRHWRVVVRHESMARIVGESCAAQTTCAGEPWSTLRSDARHVGGREYQPSGYSLVELGLVREAVARQLLSSQPARQEALRAQQHDQYQSQAEEQKVESHDFVVQARPVWRVELVEGVQPDFGGEPCQEAG